MCERQEGWYWVKQEGFCAWEPTWLSQSWWDGVITGDTLPEDFWSKIGQRIPSPEEPWQTVPVEATEEMERSTTPGCGPSQDWEDMLSAAPKP